MVVHCYQGGTLNGMLEVAQLHKTGPGDGTWEGYNRIGHYTEAQLKDNFVDAKDEALTHAQVVEQAVRSRPELRTNKRDRWHVAYSKVITMVAD